MAPHPTVSYVLFRTNNYASKCGKLLNGCGLAATDAAGFRRRTPALEGDAYLLAPETRYFITDHLGSTRVVLKGDGTLSMKADYLPYGGLISGSGLNVTENDYLWIGKELQHQIFDTPAYDSSARLLFTNGLFASPDPLAEKYPGISPYAYCAGNPVNKIDLDGNDEWEINSHGEVVNIINNTDHDAFYIVDNDGNRMVASDGSFLSISFTYNSFSYSVMNSTTAFLSSDVTAGADLFKFMADFTDVEQGLIIGDFGAFVFNEGERSKISVTVMAQSISKRWDTSISRLIHSHPSSSEPSNKDGNGDIPVAQKILLHVPRYVYLPASNKLIPYYRNGSSDPIPWKSLFPKSRF